MLKTEPGMAGHGLSVSIQGVSRHYDQIKAVDDVTLDIEPGEFLSLVGPSGSGKTTLLMMLAGFEAPTAGRFLVGGRDLTRAPPNQRNIGMVFQKYALFPHRSVAENIGFPLRMRGMGRAERDDKIQRALDMVKLPGYGTRMPAQLSGGQQQRVALARAIVFEPPVVLMDEPLGALDKKLRQHMQIEIKDLQGRLGSTVIYVTHDQEEALTMSDRVAVLNQGRVVQLGPPRELYDHPANAFVAEFLGDMNFIAGQVIQAEDGLGQVRALSRIVPARIRNDAELAPGTEVRIAVRPERVNVRVEPASGDFPDGLTGYVSRLVFNGASIAILVQLGDGGVLRADVSAQSGLASLRSGDPVSVEWSADDAHVYPRTAQ